MFVNKELLNQLMACPSQIEIFEQTFPEGTEITKESIEKAAEAGLDLYWFASKFKNKELKDVQRRYYSLCDAAKEIFSKRHENLVSMFNFSPWRMNLTDYMRMHDENNAFFNNASKSIRESYNKAIDYLILSL